MTSRHSFRLAFMMRESRHDLDIEVCEAVWRSASARFSLLGRHAQQTPFLVIRTVDGRCVALNTDEVQGLSFLFDPVPETTSIDLYAGPVQIQLKGRAQPLEEWVWSDQTMAGLILALELGPDYEPYPRIKDVDGEEFCVNAREVVYVVAQGSAVTQGYRDIA